MSAMCRVRDTLDETNIVGSQRRTRATWQQYGGETFEPGASTAALHHSSTASAYEHRDPLRIGVHSHSQPIPTDDLYPAPDVGSPELSRARSLLSVAADQAEAAAAAFESGDVVESDLRVLRLQGALSELFVLRAIGEGFAALVNALWSALENQNGAPLNLEQIHACSRIIAVVRGEPFVDFASATEHIDILENTGLEPTPRGYDALTDWLDGEGIR